VAARVRRAAEFTTVDLFSCFRILIESNA